MSQLSSAFKNLCLRVPVDPISKMPKSAYERSDVCLNKQCSINSSTTSSVQDVETVKFKEFYRSIPDYNDINHLPPEEFYSTLKSLREKRKVMLGLAIEFIDDNNGHSDKLSDQDIQDKADERKLSTALHKSSKSKRKLSTEYKAKSKICNNTSNSSNDSNSTSKNLPGTCLKRSVRKLESRKEKIDEKHIDDVLKVTPLKSNLEKTRSERPKRNHSACSISWNDAKIENEKNVIDQKFEHFFDGKKYDSPSINITLDDNDEFKTQSMPSSPLRMKRIGSPTRHRKGITIPKPFKMTERDEEERVVNELRCLQKSFSDDMLHQKCERKNFKAKPVPIESRIPLYDKILQDQAMRRAITKINSEAELRAQMKPFSFTKREEKGLSGGMCDRAVHILPKSKKKKRFKARPVPKNLFSNYFYDKMKEDEFFRSMNKRIRAEEMLRYANYPGSMATRDRSRLSTPAAHSDLPIDPSPGIPSISSSDRQKMSSPIKERKKKERYAKENFITTSPQPFRFNTANRAAKKMHDVAMKIYQENKSTVSGGSGTIGEGPGACAYSALDLRASASGRSNLAALLRAEAVRRRFEIEGAKHLAEQRRRNEMRQRDRQLRSKPAWHLVKNNHEEDIAMRLQTRRDEERMRREEFLHEMELMYGRVQQQPMLFERYYAPRSLSVPLDTLQLSPRKTTQKRISSKKKSYHYNSPNRSRKVSINDIAETYSDDVTDFLNKIDMGDKYSDSEIVSDILDRAKI